MSHHTSHHEALDTIGADLPPEESLALAVPDEPSPASGASEHTTPATDAADTPQVIEGGVEPVGDAEATEADGEEPAEASVAKHGVGHWLAERRHRVASRIGGAVDGWVDNRLRAERARRHLVEERSITREAVARLPHDAPDAQLLDMKATIRQERAEAAATKRAEEAAKAERGRAETQKRQDLAEAAHLEAAATRFEQDAAKVHEPAFTQYKAVYDKLQPQVATAWQGMQETSQAHQIALRAAQSARERAAALRAQYEATPPNTEPNMEPAVA